MLSLRQQDGLVKLLERCSVLRDVHARSELVSRLPHAIQCKVPHASSLRLWLSGLVRICADHEGGIRALYEQIRWFEGTSTHLRAIEAFLADLQCFFLSNQPHSSKPTLLSLAHRKDNSVAEFLQKAKVARNDEYSGITWMQLVAGISVAAVAIGLVFGSLIVDVSAGEALQENPKEFTTQPFDADTRDMSLEPAVAHINAPALSPYKGSSETRGFETKRASTVSNSVDARSHIPPRLENNKNSRLEFTYEPEQTRPPLPLDMRDRTFNPFERPRTSPSSGEHQ